MPADAIERRRAAGVPPDSGTAGSQSVARSVAPQGFAEATLLAGISVELDELQASVARLGGLLHPRREQSRWAPSAPSSLRRQGGGPLLVA